MTTQEFTKHLQESSPDDLTIDGAVQDYTEEASKDSAFAPVAQVEIDKMGDLMAQMADAAKTREAINHDAHAEAKAKKVTRMPLRKISGKDFFRLKHDKAFYVQNVRVIDLRYMGASTLYLVAPSVELPAAIRKEIKLANIYTGMTATKEPFLLYIPKSTTTWYDSAIEMMRLALNQFIKVEANMTGNAYDYYPAPHVIAEPDWTSLPSFNEMLALAFKGRIIESADHPAIRRKLGLEDDGTVADDGAL